MHKEYEFKFCVSCYMESAMTLSENLIQMYPHDSKFALKLVPGEAGQFDVMLDGKLIYSKAETNRIPKIQDIAKNDDGTVVVETTPSQKEKQNSNSC